MSGASSQQLYDLRDELQRTRIKYIDALRTLDSLVAQRDRVKRICLDHNTCECSAAVMILAVIGDA